jgi:alpha-tubulin suppressor-like RCC1 family protein
MEGVGTGALLHFTRRILTHLWVSPILLAGCSLEQRDPYARAPITSRSTPAPAPTLSSLFISSANPTNSTTLTLTYGSRSGAFSSYCIRENSTSLMDCIWTTGSSLPSTFAVGSTNGSKYLSIWLRNSAGAVSSSVTSNTVTLDTTAPATPTITRKTPTSSPGLSATPTFTVSGVNSGDTVSIYTGSGCDLLTLKGSTVASGSSVDVTSSALDTGSYSFFARSRDPAGNLSDCSAVSASYQKVASAATLTLSPASPYNFGNVAVGGSQNITLTLTNSGGVNASSISLTGLSGVFSTSNNTCSGILTPGASCTYTLEYAPVAVETSQQTLTIGYTDDLGTSGSLSFTLAGTGTSTPLLNFIGATGTSGTVGMPLLVAPTAISAGSGATVSNCAIKSGTTPLPAGLSVNNNTCTITGTPSAASALTKYTLTLTSSLSQSVDADVNLSVLASPAILTLSPASPYNFGNVAVGGSQNITLTLTNSGGVNASSISLTGLSGVFSNTNTGTCSETLAPGASCTYTLEYTPVAVTTSQQTLTIGYTDDLGTSGSLSFTLAGTGVNDRPQAIVAGFSHSCARFLSGQIKCWGDAPSPNVLQPTLIPEISNATQIAAGAGRHTCAIVSGGAVRCWGNGTSGQLGNGANPSFSATPVPVQLQAGESAIGIAVGEGHSCALLQNRTVKCWGANGKGQLGNGQSGPGLKSLTPVTVLKSSGSTAPLSEVNSLFAGGNHTCAILQDTEVRCWGGGTSGQLGNKLSDNQNFPVAVIADSNGTSNLSGVLQLALGQAHTCARLTNGITCWGLGVSGQLGNEQNNSYNHPIPLFTLLGKKPIQISAGANHTCAIDLENNTLCWGANSTGQLGVNDDTNRDSPTLIPNLPGITSIAGGDQHTCALLTSGGARCWGFNGSGQLGNNSKVDSWGPVQVLGLP